MKVALVCDMAYPFHVGGAELRNFEVARRLAAGHEVHLFAVKLWDGPDVVERDGLFIHGVCRYSGGGSFSGSRRFFEPVKFAVKLFKPLLDGGFDVIDASAFPYAHCFSCRLVSALRRTPLVLTWHLYGGDYWRANLGFLRGVFVEAAERAAVHLTRNHIAVSETVGDRLVAAGAGRGSVRVIRNGVDVKEADSVEVHDKTYDIVYVGKLMRQKNVGLLIQAVGLLKRGFPEIKACIIGEGPERGRLREMVVELGLEGNVVFTGLVADRRRLYTLLKSARVSVLPSLIEGFGLAALEAGACGIPVVVVDSRWNASKELVDGNGLVVGNSPEALASAIRRLLVDDALRAGMALKAVEKSRAFGWDGVAAGLERFYGGLVR